jgi:hypothetical protein
MARQPEEVKVELTEIKKKVEESIKLSWVQGEILNRK